VLDRDLVVRARHVQEPLKVVLSAGFVGCHTLKFLISRCE
jgi:hypothetical protein